VPIARLWGIGAGAPIGGCDLPHPASKAAAALMLKAKRGKVLTCYASGG
jgi:hypothetical protein